MDPVNVFGPKIMDEKRYRIRLTYTAKLLAGFSVSIAMLLAISIMADFTMVKQSNSVRSTMANQLEDLTMANRLLAESVTVRLAEVQLPKFSDVWAISYAVDDLTAPAEKFDEMLSNFTKNRANWGDESADFLNKSWSLYRNKLKETIRLVNNSEQAEAEEHSMFASWPRFQDFSNRLQHVSVLIDQEASQKLGALNEKVRHMRLKF